MGKGLKRLWSFITTLIVAAAVILAMLLTGVRIFGLKVFTVLSGSMEPLYHTGSLIYVKKTDPFKLKTGDVITFMLNEDTVVTHRIAGVVPDEDDPSVIRFRTRGDANAAEDGTLVHYKNVIGCPVFQIPKLGYAADYIQHPPGIYVTIAAGAFLMLLMFLPELVNAIMSPDEAEQKEKKKAKKPGEAAAEKSVSRRAGKKRQDAAGRHEKNIPAGRTVNGSQRVKGRHEA